MPGPEALHPLRTLAASLRKTLAGGPVPLLAVRVPQFAGVAWRDGRRAAARLERRTSRAFAHSARRVLRGHDDLAHDAGSDLYAIAMRAAARDRHLPSPGECRGVLERIAAAIALECEVHAETGWTMLHQLDEEEALRREIGSALERGARERERYEFFAAIGHELRTPLTSIRGYLETLLEGDLDPQTSRTFLSTARREALRLGRLLDGMFELSLLDLSPAAWRAGACDLGEQAQFALDAMRPRAAERCMKLHADVPRGIVVGLNPDACAQMLLNLLDNAIKYGRERGEVAIGTRIVRPFVFLTVDDDGPGVATTERDSIFAMSLRGAQALGRRGAGIGLAVVKTIVERAGGEIRAGDSPVGGARFEVALPVRAESAVPVS